MNISSHRIFFINCGLSALLLLGSGCAKESTIDTSKMAKDYFDAWVSINYPGATPTGLGVYIIEDQPGAGEYVKDDDMYLFADHTITDLDGNVSGTTSETLSQQLGSYAKVNYYGEDVIVNDRLYTETGVLEMIKGMRVGGTRKAIIPSWLYTIADYDTEAEYLKKNAGSNVIYTVSITDKTDDISSWEIKKLSKYVERYMDSVDSTKFGFYCKTLVESTDTATFSEDTTFYINYTGRLLNGHVFDTTIEDTAKFYGIYNASKTYGPMYVTMSQEYTEITIASDMTETGTTTIDGFSYCLSRMKPMEKVVCAFYSKLGYGYSGSGSSIPKYAPLVFEIEAVAAPDDSE